MSDLSNSPDKLAYLTAILENVTDVVSILDAKGKIIYASAALKSVLGYETEEFVGQNAFTFVHPEEYTDVFGLFLRVIAQNKPTEKTEVRFKHKDGSWHYLECLGKNLLNDPVIRGIVVSGRDITERRSDEAQRRLQSHALEAAANGIVITDVSGKILWVNPMFTKMTGYAFDEAVGQNPRILKSGEQPVKVYEELWRTILSGGTWSGELINRRKDGTLYFEKQTITPVRNENGEIVNFIAIKEDISERKQMEAQFRQAQKMEAVGQLAGGVAHDFNNLLTIILGQSEMALMQMDADNPIAQKINDILEAGRRAAALTRQLLAFSRRQIFQMKVTDLNEIVMGADKMIRRLLGEDIEFVTLPREGCKKIKVDAAQMDQVLMNLAVNARDAMPRGGKLIFEVGEAKVDIKTAQKYPAFIPGEYVTLQVRDTGTGMTPEVKEHIFEPFFTTKEKGKGTGLGLSTVYGVIKQSMGFIYAESEIGKGTAFTLYFPAAQETAAESMKSAKTAPQMSRGSETVLFVEDEEIVRTLGKRILTHQGFRVLEAHNGVGALEMLKTDEARNVSLVVTDMVMPFMGGNELAEKVSAQYPKIKIIFTSGYANHAAVQKWVTSGSRFIQKPYRPSELVMTIREVLDAK